MLVKELIEYLKTQDQEAIVELEVSEDSGGYGGCVSSVIDLDADKHIEYIDMRGNPYVKPEALYYNKRYLRFGN